MQIDVKKYFNRQNLKDFLSGLVLVAITFISLFFLLEVFLRVIKIQSDNFIMPDPILGWTHLPNQEGYSRGEGFSVKVKLNKDGFIGRDYGYLKPDNTIRILVVGDSLTEAFQVEESESYSQLLENGLKTSFSNVNFEVLNMGIAGYGTEREYYVFKNKGLKFNPDIVILGFFTGNDFSDNMAEKINPEASFSEFRDFKNKIKLFFRNYSTAWRFILRQKSRNRFLAYLKNINRTEPNQEFGQRNGQLEAEAQADRSALLIINFKKLADKNSIDLVVAVLPAVGQVYSDKDGNRDYLTENLSQNLLSFLKKEKIDYIDLLPHFKDWVKLNPDKTLYLPLDGHPSKYGHQVIAESIANYLTEFLKKNGDF